MDSEEEPEQDCGSRSCKYRAQGCRIPLCAIFRQRCAGEFGQVVLTVRKMGWLQQSLLSLRRSSSARCCCCFHRCRGCCSDGHVSRSGCCVFCAHVLQHPSTSKRLV